MFGLENTGETLIFMSRHIFDETMTIFDFAFSPFGALKILTDDYFALRINQIIYSKQKKIDVLLILLFFPALFLQQVFPFTLYWGQFHKSYNFARVAPSLSQIEQN